MSDEAWNAGFVKCLGVRLAGDLIGDVDERGEPIVGDTLLLLLNAPSRAVAVHAAGDQGGAPLGAAAGHGRPGGSTEQWHGGQPYPLRERSLAVLRTRRPEETTMSTQQVETLLKAKERLPAAAGMLTVS